ncbi:hypothetical protein PLICRDRAFT_98150 [Plicaturopsis crispa FD-325 SS-3]|nr:hypothetical protein PLICRDRAFT_98150 [Plicaturopsis crispa FD-325 SS-3]
MSFDDAANLDSPLSDNDQMLFPLDFDDGNHLGASPPSWDPYRDYSAPAHHHTHTAPVYPSSSYNAFNFDVPTPNDRDFDSGAFSGMGGVQSALPEFGDPNFYLGNWLNEPELPALEPSTSPIPIRSPPLDPQTPPSFVPYLGHSTFPQNASFSPSEFASTHPLPRSASPPEESKVFQRFTSVSPRDTSLHPPVWASDLWDSPGSSRPASSHSPAGRSPHPDDTYTIGRHRFPMKRDSTPIGFQSSSAPSPLHIRSPGQSRPYSRRAESVSVSDDRDATVRRKKRLVPEDPLRNIDAPADTRTQIPHSLAKSLLRPPKLAPSAWQLYFTDWIQRQQASNTRKLNVAQAAKEAGQEYASLSPEEKEPYKRRSQAAKELRERELAAYMRTLTPDDIKRENAFRAAQRKAGKSRKSNIKDPNAPKKPLSAYFMFLQRIRSDPALVRDIFGDETETTKQSVLAAGKWRSMTDDERKPFLAQAEQEKLDYEAARRLYEEGSPGHSSSINFSILPGSPAETAFRASRPISASFSSESESEGFGTDDGADRYRRS